MNKRIKKTYQEKSRNPKMPKKLRKNEADFSWRRRRIFTGHGKYVRTPDSNYPKRRAEIITAQNKGCMIRAPCVSKPQHIFFYN